MPPPITSLVEPQCVRRVHHARVVVGDSWDFDRFGTGGNDAVVKRKGRRFVVGFDGNLICRAESGAALEYADLAAIREPAQTLAEVADDAIFEGAHPLEIEARFPEVDAAIAHFAHLIYDFCDMQQRLRGDATDVEADAAEFLVAFDQHDLLAEIGSPKSRRVATWAATDHDDLSMSIRGRETSRCSEGGRFRHGFFRDWCLLRGGVGDRLDRVGVCRGDRFGGGWLLRVIRLESEDQRALGDVTAQFDAEFSNDSRLRTGDLHRSLVALDGNQRIVSVDPISG